MVDKFIFDVDGTLTPSRQEIDMDFAVFFTDFCAEKDVYLVTGSDREKTIEQVGEEIYSPAQRVYNCPAVMFGKVVKMYTQVIGGYPKKQKNGYVLNVG